MRVGIYARVSTSDQSCALQLEELRRYCQARGWEIVNQYVDQGVSGASIKKRVAFRELMQDASQRRFDVVVCSKLDRFGRSVVDLATSLQTLDACGVRFLAVSQGIDTDQANPTSRLLLNILSCVSEFEKCLINERTQGGLQAYKRDWEAGKVGTTRSSKSGRNLPIGGQKKIFDRSKVTQLRAQKKSIREIASALGISVGTVANTLAADVQRTGEKVGAPRGTFSGVTAASMAVQ
jgi:DNA invertase Pin-like site-specific DNA recombinase